MPFKFAISEVELSSGDHIAVPPRGITLLVGPNNVGKSRCLREIALRVGIVQPRGAHVHAVTKTLQTKREGTADEFYSWLTSRYQVRELGERDDQILGVGFNVRALGGLKSHTRDAWTQPDSGLILYGPALGTYLDTSNRLGAANAVGAIDPLTTAPTVPLQALYTDEVLESQLSSTFRTAFGVELAVDRLAAGQITIRCGIRPDATQLGGHLSIPYAKEVRQRMEFVSEQGDGMKSYLACLLYTDVLQRPLVLIDEPEAFLHPPQARLLAQHLAREATGGDRQVVLATHSSDIVRGALDGGADVSVVRLTRSAAANHAKQLDASAIRNLWSDPLLRASNLLDALFHRQLVLCEGDGDCRFYRAVLDAIWESGDFPRPDVMFAHTGGKHKLPVAVRAVVSAGVPTRVIVDIDALQEEKPLRGIWEALGGTWEEIADDRRCIAAAVRNGERRISLGYFHEQVNKIVAESSDANLEDATADRIRGLMRSETGWSAVKRGGLAAIPSGDASERAEHLLAKLAGRGLHVVPVGELERFIQSVAGHGPEWVADALQLDLAADPKLEQARKFVRSLRLQ